jgi:antitoxin (DNA-binding transcriptional repressor) of toxin-antitoxin stability system
MVLTVKVGQAMTHLSDLLAKVEAGEEVVIARGERPVARVTRYIREDDFQSAVAEIKAARASRAPTTTAEILSWRDEGRRR